MVGIVAAVVLYIYPEAIQGNEGLVLLYEPIGVDVLLALTGCPDLEEDIGTTVVFSTGVLPFGGV